MKSMNTFINENLNLLTEDRVDFMKDQVNSGKLKLDTSHETDEGVKTHPHDIIDHFHNGLSDANKPYLPRVLQWYNHKTPEERIRQHDIGRVNGSLDRFREATKRKTLPPAQRDINVHKTLGGLDTALAQTANTQGVMSKNEQDEDSIKKGRTEIFNNGRLRVSKFAVGPHGKRANIALHKGPYDGNPNNEPDRIHTAWCTAADGAYNHYDSYTRQGHLYTFHFQDEDGKHRVHQYHPVKQEFKNESQTDNPTMEDFVRKYPELKGVKELQGTHDALPLGKERRNEIQGMLGRADSNLQSTDIHIAKKKRMNIPVDDLVNNPDAHGAHVGLLQAGLTGRDHEKTLVNNPNSLGAHALIAGKTHDKDHIDTLLSNPKSEDAHAVLAQRDELTPKQMSFLWKTTKNPHTKIALLASGHDDDTVTPDTLHKAFRFAAPELKAKILRHKKSDESLLLKGLDDKDVHVRRHAVEHPNATEPVLMKGLDDEDVDVRYGAVSHPKATEPVSMRGLDDEHWQIRRDAVSHPKATEPVLMKGLDDEDVHVRRHAVEHPNATEPVLMKGLDDKNGDVRYGAVRNPKATEPVLMKGLDGEHWEVRFDAVSHPKATESMLMKGLDDEDVDVRRVARERLDKLQNKRNAN